MSRYIDADKLVELCDEMSRNEWNKKVSPISWADAYESFVDDIDEIPTADVVAVVRCRDCKHNQDNGGDCNRTITHTSRNLVCEVNEYKYIGLEYCSYGERREENEGDFI